MIIQSLEGQTLSRQNKYLTPSHSVTQPPNHRSWFVEQFFIFFILVDRIQDQSLVMIFYQIVFVHLINENLRYFRYVNCILQFFFFFFGNKKQGKLQITPLKFESDWILHPIVSKYGFGPLKIGDIWILYPNVSKFEFYSIYFRSVWILLPKILECLDFTP